MPTNGMQPAPTHNSVMSLYYVDIIVAYTQF